MSTPSRETLETARRLHSAVIHLLRALRRQDAASGVGPARLSALSVLVFGGPTTLGALAQAEQVRPPTMTRLVNALEADGLVVRERDPADGRVTYLRASTKGQALLKAGRSRRVAALARQLGGLGGKDRDLLARAATLLERLASD